MQNSECWYKEVCTNKCSSACIRFVEMKALMDSSNIPKRKQVPQTLNAPECDYDAYCELAGIKDSIVDFVDNGDNLYIMSKYTGNGKTSWAIKLMLKYFNEVWAGNGMKARGLFIHVPTFLLKCKDFNNRDEVFEAQKKLLKTVDLVIWDDIASTDISAYDYSQLLMYIDGRILDGLSNIYTGNIESIPNMTKIIGAKLASRIMADSTTIVKFKGGDMR